MSTSYIHDIFPSYQSSFKLASPVKTVGVLQQDNKYAVGGTVGAIPETVPFRLTMTNQARGINRVLNMKIMKDPLLTPSLMQQVTQETLSDTLGMDSNKMVRINFAMKVKNAPEIRRSNYVYAQDEVTSAALGDMLGSLVLTQANPFSRGNIERVSLNVQVEPKRQTAILKSIFADRNRARAGETVNISVVLETQPPPAKTYTRVFSFRIPADAPSGLLRVAAGPASEYWTLRTRVGDAPPSPDNLNDLITEFNKAGSSTDLQVHVSTPSTFLMVDKTRVPNPPATWEKLLRAAPSTSVGSYNEVQSKTQTTSLSLSGMQLLALPVESARISDKVAPDSSTVTTTTPDAGTDATTTAPPTLDATPDTPPEAPPNFAMPDGGDDSAATRGGNFAPINFTPREYSQLTSTTTSTDNLRAQASNWWSGVALLAAQSQRARLPRPASELAAVPSPRGASASADAKQEIGVGAGRRAFAEQSRAASSLAGTFASTRTTFTTTSQNLSDAQPQQVPGREPTIRPIVTPTAAPLPGITPQPTAKPIVTPTPAPTTPAEGATLGRPARSWIQGNAVDFARGDFRGAEVTSEGTLRAAALGKRIATTTEPFAWSVAADSRGNTFLGTGNNARILKVDARGTTTTLYNGREVAITALAVDSADNLYAGLSPGGRVLRFGAGISAPVTISQTLETFIWALDFDADGNLIVATGSARGALYRVANPATALAPTTRIATAAGVQYVADRPFATVPQKHIRAISISKDGIFAGTSDDAVLYQIDAKSGDAKPLFQQVMPAAAAAASTRNSSVVTASSPGGSSGLPSSVFFLLRSALAGDASSASIPSNVARPEILAVAAAPEGIYFGLSNSGTLYRYNAASGVQAIYPSPQNAIYALQRDRDGSIIAATGEKGIVYRITPREDGRAAVGARILEPTQTQALSLNFTPRGDLLIGTGNNAALYRVDANQREGTFVSNVFDAGNLVNWGALRVLGSGVNVETRSGNVEEPDASWSDWQSAARNDLNELRVVSPTSRFLQYRAQLSGGDAKLSRLEVIYRTQNGAPSVAFSSPKGGEFWRATQKPSWTGTDPDADTLRYKLWIASGDGDDWKSVALKTPTSPLGELDTTKFSDGLYRLRVEASDVARNPVDPKTAQAVSLPFTIDNTAPTISNARTEKGAPDDAASTRDDSGAPQWTLRATATDATSPIIGAEWRLISAAQLEAENKKAAAAKAAASGDTTAPTATPTPVATPASTRGAAKPAMSAAESRALALANANAAKTASITPNNMAAVASVPELVPLSGAMVGAAVGAGALPDDSSATAAGWQAVAAADGLFDSRREELLAVVEETPPTSTDEGAKTPAPAATSPRVLQLRVRDAAGNTATTTLPLP